MAFYIPIYTTWHILTKLSIVLYIHCRIAYSVFALEHLLSTYDSNTPIKIMYDIACTLTAHLKVNKIVYIYILSNSVYTVIMSACYFYENTTWYIQFHFGEKLINFLFLMFSEKCKGWYPKQSKLCNSHFSLLWP